MLGDGVGEPWPCPKAEYAPGGISTDGEALMGPECMVESSLEKPR